MKSMIQSPKNWRLLSAFGGLLLVLALAFVACGSSQTGSSTPALNTPGTTVYTYKGHPYVVLQLAWTPDSKYIASGDSEHNIHVWEAMTGNLIRTFSTGRHNGGGFALSPDGKYIATGFEDHTVKVLDIMTGNTLLTYTGHSGDIGTIDWSPDGKYIASADGQTMQVWEAMTGKTILTYKIPQKTEIDTAFGLLWSPDGKYIAVGGISKTVLVLDAMTGKVRSTYSGHTEVGAGPVAWSPDSKYIVSESWDLTTQVWEAMTGKHIHTFQQFGPVAWSPDSNYLALGNPREEHNVQVWDTKTWHLRLTYTGHQGNTSVNAVAWSPDGKYIASGGEDKTVRVWIAP
jgi:WD40 repeat protein